MTLTVGLILSAILPAKPWLRFSSTVLAASILLVATEPGRADRYADAREHHRLLFNAYYQKGVLEYCGLLTPEARQGFEWQVEDMLAAAPMSAAEQRDVRIAGLLAVNLEYEDRGLSGQRYWCQTEGIDAFFQFFDLFRGRNWSRGASNGSE